METKMMMVMKMKMMNKSDFLLVFFYVCELICKVESFFFLLFVFFAFVLFCFFQLLHVDRVGIFACNIVIEKKIQFQLCCTILPLVGSVFGNVSIKK